MSDRVALVNELKDQMKRLAAELQVYSPDWELVGKTKYEGYQTSMTDTYIQRLFKDNGHQKGWLAVYVDEHQVYDENGNIVVKYFVRLNSSKRRHSHVRNWTFKTSDLPEKIQARSEEVFKEVAEEIAREREEQRQSAEAASKLSDLFDSIPGWEMKYGSAYSLSSEVTGKTKGRKWAYEIHTSHNIDTGVFRHTLDLGNLSHEEIALVIKTLVDHGS